MLPLPPSLSAIICISCSPAATSSGCTEDASAPELDSAAFTAITGMLGLGRSHLRPKGIRLHRHDDDGVDPLVDQLVDLTRLGGDVAVGRVPQQFDVVVLGVRSMPSLPA